MRCYVQEVLKGQITSRKEMTLSLLPPENFISFAKNSTYLVFLKTKSDLQTGTTYESLYAEGDVIEVGWQNNGLPTKGATTKEKIQTLIRQYIKQRDERLKRENVLLNKMLK